MKEIKDIGHLGGVNKRIDFVRITFNFPPNQFARKLGVANSVVENIINKEGHRPSFGFTENLCSIFPLRKEWLYAGSGDPFYEKDLESYMYSDDDGLTTLKKGADKVINDKIRTVRLSKGFSQATFAADIKVSRDVVASMENGRQSVPPYILYYIAHKYDVNMNWLYYDIGEMWLKDEEKINKKDKVLNELKKVTK